MSKEVEVNDSMINHAFDEAYATDSMYLLIKTAALAETTNSELAHIIQEIYESKLMDLIEMVKEDQDEDIYGV